jgi:hypothetical protein
MNVLRQTELGNLSNDGHTRMQIAMHECGVPLANDKQQGDMSSVPNKTVL